MAWQILARLILTFVLIASAVAWEAPPVLLSGLVIFGSAVGLIFRGSRRTQMEGGPDRLLLEDTLDQRLQEFEDRQYAELEYVEERTDARFSEAIRRLADLEERLESAEQELASYRGTGTYPHAPAPGVPTPI